MNQIFVVKLGEKIDNVESNLSKIKMKIEKIGKF